MKKVFAQEDRLANQRGTWQNWIYRKVPTPIDYIGLPGTGYNLGALARSWSGKPQLDYDFGRMSFYSSHALGQLTGVQALEDRHPHVVD